MEVKTSLRYTFFNVEFKGNFDLFPLSCQQSAVPDCGQDIISVVNKSWVREEHI